MKKILGLVAVIAVAASASQHIKRAAFAGQFYEKDPVRLAAAVDEALAGAAHGAVGGGRLIGLIAPHAGHVYSGATAAAAYASARGRDVETVVVVGPSHQFGFRGCSIWPDGGFETPLGTVPVDAEMARDVMRASGFRFLPEAFAREHSIEVQIPFIQRAFPKASILPVVMGLQTEATIEKLAAALEAAGRGKSVLVVASTDLSHFLPEEEAEALDAATAELIRAGDAETLIRKVEAGENIMCGGGPVVTVLLLARRAGRLRVELLRRTDSAGFGGPVVGYLAAAVLADGPEIDGPLGLDEEDRKAVLRLARTALVSFVERGELIDPSPDRPRLEAAQGVFVTLKMRGELRGCVGFPEPAGPLGRAVVQAAALAASRDPRFPPVTPAELRDLLIEVSVLGPLLDIDDPKSVRVGRHGLVVSRGDKRGLLLPQVPVENGWDRTTFLRQACLKAGLPGDAWRRGARLQVFETFVFHE